MFSPGRSRVRLILRGAFKRQQTCQTFLLPRNKSLQTFQVFDLFQKNALKFAVSYDAAAHAVDDSAEL